jgi:ComF family protein
MNLFRSLLDLIYPSRCLICQDFLDGNSLDMDHARVSFCRACFNNFQEVTSPLCPLCGRPFLSGIDVDHLCEDCLRKRPFYEAAAAPYIFEGPVMAAIHQFKYAGKSHMAKSLGPILGEFAAKWLHSREGILTMPIPLHPKRLRERGFNQSLLLARHVGRELYTELDFLSLRRVRYTKPQTGLGKEERRKNVRRAFELRGAQSVKGKTILLVDDVATTGNTLNECAKVLKRAGAEKVLCLVLARATNP